MPDELTLLPCPWCGNKEVYWTHSSDGEGGSAYVYCSDCDACGPQGKAYTKNGFSDEADQRWNTRVPDPALAAKDQRIAELEDEIAALKQPPTYHDVDAYYRPETCEWCKWFAKAGGIAWCGHESGPGEWTGTREEPCCDKWQGKEGS